MNFSSPMIMQLGMTILMYLNYPKFGSSEQLFSSLSQLAVRLQHEIREVEIMKSLLNRTNYHPLHM